MTFSNPLFDSNDDFTSSDDESLPDEDVSKDNVKIYSNPLFEFDDEYISSEVNPLFNEELEDIESNESWDSFASCLSNLDIMLKRCEDTNLVLNWEKCHFMCKEGIVLGHKISKSRIEVDRAKVDVIAKLPHPSIVKELLQIKEMADQDTPPPTITAMKIPIIKKGEYDIWREQSSPPVPKTAKQLAARRNQERIKSILLLAIPDEYLLKFHNVPDAKSLWAAIKSRFGGNEESKKMQKNVLKHQFENFVTTSNETLDKAYDRFQKLISQLEIHGAYVSKEDINQKFLRSLPPLMESK
ncbi:hypothetical protein Tco_0435383 [Tanacetum coccineum]